jgi:hypothetical protein
MIVFISFSIGIFSHKGEQILPHRLPRSQIDVLEYAITGNIVAAKATLARESPRILF